LRKAWAQRRVDPRGGSARDPAGRRDRRRGRSDLGKTDEGGFDGFVLARYTPGGRLDSSFGEGGSVLTDFDPGRCTATIVSGLAIQADGRIVVAG